MADRLYLSIWLNGFSPLNMHQAFSACLRKFPFTSQSTQLYLRVGAVDPTEPALQEEPLDATQGLEPLLEAMSHWTASDASFEVEGFWDLWQERPEGWRLYPARVNLFFHGPNFPSEWGEQIRIEFGIEEMFLPGLDAEGRALALLQSNIRSLLRLTRELDGVLKIKEKKLWSESGENFAERLRQSLETPTRQ